MYYNKTAKLYIYQDWDVLIPAFNQLIADDNIFSISRLGGVDFQLANRYFVDSLCFDNEKYYTTSLYEAKNMPGYFDFDNKKENFISYVQKIIKYYEDIDAATYANLVLRNQIDRDDVECAETTKKFLDFIIQNKNKVIMNYSIIEGIRPFLDSFKIWGEDKKILIVSPLSKSIEHQYKRKNDILKNYIFPNFELKTCTTNLTWQHDNDTKEKLGLITNNWHEECDRLSEEISKIDFDIAFLSCGSYAMHLGYFLKNVLRKKSIYIGGVLNVMFAIYGGRYDCDYYMKFHTPGYLIDPFENENAKKITAGRNWKTESLNAYFGHQKK